MKSLSMKSVSSSLCVALVVFFTACGSDRQDKQKGAPVAPVTPGTADVKSNPDSLNPAAIAQLEAENRTLELERTNLLAQVAEANKNQAIAEKNGQGGGGLESVIGAVLGTVLGGSTGQQNSTNPTPNGQINIGEIIKSVVAALSNKDYGKAKEQIATLKTELAAKLKICEDKIRANNEKIAKGKMP